LSDIAIRFLVGGLFVTGFALIADVFKPKSFAGIFGAAPSVALATLGLTIGKNGKDYAALEARSMIAGAAALLVYCAVVTWLLKRRQMRALSATISAMPVWFIVAFGSWYVWLR
jgi:hydrogenase-4 membrane subunit HyfE